MKLLLHCFVWQSGGGEGGGGGEMERYRFRLRFAFFSSCIQPRSWRQIKVVLFESTVFKIALAFAFTRG